MLAFVKSRHSICSRNLGMRTIVAISLLGIACFVGTPTSHQENPATECVNAYFNAWQAGDVWKMYSRLDRVTRSKVSRKVFVGALLRPATVDGKVVGEIRFHPSEVSAGPAGPTRDGTTAVEYRVVFHLEHLSFPLDASGREGEDLPATEVFSTDTVEGSLKRMEKPENWVWHKQIIAVGPPLELAPEAAERLSKRLEGPQKMECPSPAHYAEKVLRQVVAQQQLVCTSTTSEATGALEFNLRDFTLWVGGGPYIVAQEDGQWVIINAVRFPPPTPAPRPQEAYDKEVGRVLEPSRSSAK